METEVLTDMKIGTEPQPSDGNIVVNSYAEIHVEVC